MKLNYAQQFFIRATLASTIILLFGIFVIQLRWENGKRNTKQIRGFFQWFFDLYCYIEDMMVLIHDELVSPLFGIKKPARQPIGKRSCVLTKKGLVYKTNKE